MTERVARLAHRRPKAVRCELSEPLSSSVRSTRGLKARTGLLAARDDVGQDIVAEAIGDDRLDAARGGGAGHMELGAHAAAALGGLGGGHVAGEIFARGDLRDEAGGGVGRIARVGGERGRAH